MEQVRGRIPPRAGISSTNSFFGPGMTVAMHGRFHPQGTQSDGAGATIRVCRGDQASARPLDQIQRRAKWSNPLAPQASTGFLHAQDFRGRTT